MPWQIGGGISTPREEEYEEEEEEWEEMKDPILELREDVSVYYGLRSHMMVMYKGLRFALTGHTLMMVFASCFFTFFCSVANISFDTSMSIISVGSVFPLIFSVNASFNRRDQALESMASLKAAILTLYLMFRTWEKQGTGRWAHEADAIFQKLLDDIEWYLRSQNPTAEHGNVVYDGFAAVAMKMNEFAPEAGFKHAGEGGWGRMSVYVRDLIVHFEGVRAIRDTETPKGLRLFCFALINTTPILLAPYWNHFCKQEHNAAWEATWYGCQSSYFICVAYVLIIFTLYRVQMELEDPFDGEGDDDIKWESWRSNLDQLGNYGENGPERRYCMSRLVDRAT